MVFLISDNLTNLIDEYNLYIRRNWTTGNKTLLSRRNSLYVLNFRLTNKGKNDLNGTVYSIDGNKILFIKKRPSNQFLIERFDLAEKDAEIKEFLRGCQKVKQ